MKRTFLILITLVIIIGAVFLVYKRKQEIGNTSQPRQVPCLVHTEPVKKGVLPIYHHYSATLMAEQQIELAPRIRGRLVQVNKYPGERVVKGETLVSLDDRQIQKQIKGLKRQRDKAQSQVWIAGKSYNRIKNLLGKGNVSQQRYDQAQSELQQSKAQLRSLEESIEEAKTRLSYTTLRAPFTGLVTKRWLDQGDLVLPDKPVLSLENPQKGYNVLVRLPAAELAQIQKGAEAVIKSGDKVFRTQVDRIYPATENRTSLGSLEICLDQKPFALPTGAILGVDLCLARPRGFIIPERAVIEMEEGRYVYVLTDNNKVRPEKVELLGIDRDKALVRGDLSAGDQLVTGNPARLLRMYKGLRVKPVNKGPGS